MSAVGGRRTYTEEELQAALRDIQSGKLGTRRAAVIYGIPRSTLRNKVYKLAMERERETHLVPPGPLGALVAEDDAMDDDKELSGAEEEKEVEKALQAPLLTMADFVRFSNIAESPDALRALLLQQHQLRSKEGAAGDMWAGMEHSALGPYIQLMMANQLAVGGAKEADFILPEIMRKIIAEEQHLNNGEAKGVAAAAAAPHPHPSPSNSIKTERLKTDSMSDMDTDDSPSNVILKIPSFKPTTSKNGGDMYRGDSGALASPPVTSESGSPPIVAAGNMLSIREAIAKSISQKFQQSPEPLKMHADIDFKRAGMTPPLAIIKNHQVPSEPPTPPAPTIPQPPTIVHTRNYQSSVGQPAHNNALPKQPNNNNTNQNNNNNSSSNNNSAGGKGTRPKRGKYRNYDRDSLVEAVRAVQRGEMSVHRAGSYYGVPHSTLEYKVKERHLMRPRKRDPKPNPVDEKIASIKNQEIRNIPDKLKPTIKPQQKFAPTSPNGMKMPPIFDPAIAPMGYNPPPFPFWPHPSFPHLPLDYPRNPSTSQFPPNPEFFASQMMQRLQEQSARCHPETSSGAGASLTSANGNTSTTAVVAPPVTPPAALAKMAESLYDGTGANGSFLDGIIRSSLESGVPPASENKEDNKNVAPENMSNKALLDQLCRNSRITPLPKANSVTTEPNSSGDESYRKGPSPLNFATKTTMEHDNGKCRDRDEIQTIELSNDSNDSTSVKDDVSAPSPTQQSPPSRIYVKPQFQEITKPENLKPEVLVRFRATADECDDSEPILIERNGIAADPVTGSASDKPDMAQD